MQIPTTRAMLLLLSIIVPLSRLSSGSSTVKQYSNQDSCQDKCIKRASSVDTALSVIGFVVSGFVSVSPVMRVIKGINEQENVAKYRWFMAFLAIVTLDYVAWAGYSLRGCGYCEAAAFMIISSIFGATVSCLWSLIGLVKDRGIVCDKEDKWFLAFCFLVCAATIGYGSSMESGYYALAGAVVAHICRVLGTDYTRLSRPQLIVSVIGSISGFLCIRHPDLDAAQPFWYSSLAIAGIRFLECLWWTVLCSRSWPKPRLWLQKARGWISDAARA